MLLEAGADKGKKNRVGKTALALAIEMKHADVSALLRGPAAG